MATVMRNLMSNAVKFSQAGGTIVVRVTLTGANVRRKSVSFSQASESAQLTTATISVKDEGVGLSKDDIGRLFQEGVQINPNKLQQGGGSGFGLFITQGIVKLHGGSVWAESEGEGLGTTFSVQLPLSDKAASVALDHPDALLPQSSSMPMLSLGDLDKLDKSSSHSNSRSNSANGTARRTVTFGATPRRTPPSGEPGPPIRRTPRGVSDDATLPATLGPATLLPPISAPPIASALRPEVGSEPAGLPPLRILIVDDRCACYAVPPSFIPAYAS